MVQRYRPSAPVVSVGAVILQGESVLLVRRGHPPRQGTWTVPGGVVELGEEVRAAVVREVWEETGLQVRVGPILDVIDYIQRDEAQVAYHYVILDFLAAAAGGALAPAGDVDDVRWVPFVSLSRYRVSDQVMSVVQRAQAIVAGGGFLLQS